MECLQTTRPEITVLISAATYTDAGDAVVCELGLWIASEG
jgi:hypothetical protein